MMSPYAAQVFRQSGGWALLCGAMGIYLALAELHEERAQLEARRAAALASCPSKAP